MQKRKEYFRIIYLFFSCKVFSYSPFFPQDTAVALQALTAFGARDTNRALYNMEIELEHADSNFTATVKLNKDNWSTLQEFDVRTLLTYFKL